MQPDSGIAGKTAIVTGGSRGIGRAIVLLLAREGADVTFFYRDNAEAASAVVAAAAEGGATVTAEQLDVRDSAACAAAVERIADRCGAGGGVADVQRHRGDLAAGGERGGDHGVGGGRVVAVEEGDVGAVGGEQLDDCAADAAAAAGHERGLAGNARIGPHR